METALNWVLENWSSILGALGVGGVGIYFYLQPKLIQKNGDNSTNFQANKVNINIKK